MSAFFLKLFAVVFMLVDHLGMLLYNHGRIGYELYILMRTLGRFAFPTYAFLLAEGWRHLRRDPKRLRSHALLLGLLAVCSEPFYDWFGHGTPGYTAAQSVMYTLLIGFCGLWLAGTEKDRPLRAGICLGSMALAFGVTSDYRAAGVLLIFASAWYLERFESWGRGRRLLAMLGVMSLYYLFYNWTSSGFGGPGALWGSLKAMSWYGIPHLLLVPILAMYSGDRGFRSRSLHRCYQWFYPAHLALLCLAGLLLG